MLYNFTTATFTPGGATGRFGPSLAEAVTGLSGPGVNDWKNNTSFFNIDAGIQLWTVPQSGLYSIEALGAAGGGSDSSGVGGKGARIKGECLLEEGEVIKILVGHVGGGGNSSTWGHGGGGGSFVVRAPYNTNPSILVIAGGGGGASPLRGASGLDAVTTNNGGASGNGTAGGTNGNGGTSTDDVGRGGGGGGFFGNGQNASSGGSGGQSFTNGGAGGISNSSSAATNYRVGAFGGGGGGTSSTPDSGGGGGGYSGGGGGDGSGSVVGGGGGGSFNSGTEQLNLAGAGVNDGAVTITFLSASDSPPSLTASVLLIAGGGAGGNHTHHNGNGGGGAGGAAVGTPTLTRGTSYVVTVGAGAAAVANATAGIGNKGSDTSLGSFTVKGGGGGGSTGVAFNSTRQSGGSGGGAATNRPGIGPAIPTTISNFTTYGFAGGSSGVSWTGAGGGGAGAAGQNGSTSAPGGNGGIGITTDITGSTMYVAGGGGGGSNTSQRAGDGFYGGGRGAGTTSYYNHTVYTNEVNATTKGSGTPNAIVNTGGGGGGGSYWAQNGGWSSGSGSGGSGIVVIRYAGAPRATGGTITTVDGDTVHTFTTSGVLEVDDEGVGFLVNGEYVTEANEGDTVTVEIKGVSSTGSVNYTITGVSSEDIDGAALSGTLNLVDTIATVTLVLTEDLSIGEGTEILTFSFEENSITYSSSLTVNDTSSLFSITPPAVAPRETVTVRLSTVNSPVADGTLIPYVISGEYITAENIGQSLTGNFVVNNNTAEFTITLGFIGSTTLNVTANNATVSCVITFNADITDPVTVTQITQTTEGDLENNLYSVTFDNFTNIILLTQTTQTTEGDLENNLYPVEWNSFLTITFEPPFVTETTESGGVLNTFVVRPLGFAPLREFWI